jgi:hypothetical protein
MNKRARRIGAAVTVLAYALLTLGPPITFADPGDQAPVSITIRVNEKGFLDEKGRLYGPKSSLRIAKGELVKITFVFNEDITSLAVGDTHQIAIQADDRWKAETDKIWVLNKQASISLRVGENGRTRYRVYCILDCLGMEHLTNLVIEVV